MTPRNVIIAVLMLVVLYMGTIFHRPLFIEDETRYAEVAREMVVHNNWVTPKLNNLDYFEKPVMGHWLNAGAMMVFGQNRFAVRFFPALAALLTGLALFMWVKHEFRDAELAAIVSLIYFTSGLVFAVGTFAVLDSQFSFFLCVTCFAGFSALESKPGLRKIALYLLCGAALGGAFLIKGFVAIALAGLPLAGYLMWQRRWKSLLLTPWLPLAVAVMVAMPWAVAIHHRSPDFWNYFFWVEHVQRFFGEVNSQHPEGPWYFLVVLPLVALPWTIFYPAVYMGFRGRWTRCFSVPALRFAACATVLPFLFLSASSGKLATYIMPMFPFMALITAAGLREYLAKGRMKLIDDVAHWVSVVLSLLLILFIIFQALCFIDWVPPEFHIYSEEEKFQYFAAMIAAIAMMFFFKQCSRQTTLLMRVLNISVGAAAMMLVVHFTMPQRFIAKLSPEVFYAPFVERVKPDTKVVAFKKLVGAACWVFRRDDVLVYENGGELTYGLSRPDGAGRLVTPAEFKTLVADPANHVVIMMDSDRRRKLLPFSRFQVWHDNLLYQEYNRP
ncbi:MAG: phospholipid carrier-dependent glycosyltransferase [Victivallaceae bacterium]|nr:phospholipid carrier-dependent glycosyltransferase [Victivallaceae bacterium]